MTQTTTDAFMLLCCPELLEPQQLISQPSKLIEIFEWLVSGKENHLNNTLIDVEKSELTQFLDQPPLAEVSLKLLRSCILLQFCTAICLVYQKEVIN